MKQIYQFFISLKLAVFNITLLALLTIIGTVIESQWDQEVANKWIYHSWWMHIILLLLFVNVFTVLVDRWPWRKSQFGFVLAHFGILILILGSFVTRYGGVEGLVRFKEGEEIRSFTVPEKEILVYSSYDGENFRLLYQKDVDFFLDPPTQKKPFTFFLDSDPFVLDSYIPYGLPRGDYKKSQTGTFSATRFYLEGSRGKFVEWIELPYSKKTITKTLGPAKIILTKNLNQIPSSSNELILYIQGDKLFYSLKNRLKKRVKPGNVFKTGWMDFNFRLLQFYPKAKKVFEFTPQDRPNENTIPSVRVSYKKNTARLGLNSFVRFYESERVYAVGYLNKRKPLGFSIKLIDFKMTPYPGSKKAKTYESQVQLDQGEIVISMNEPLKMKGYTFYQSSYEVDEKGEPSISILSVNKDPGRWIKYFGSLILVLGIAFLFLKRRLKILFPSYF